MKLIHYINFIFIIALLAFICIIEEVTVSNSLENIQNRCYKIEQMVDNTDGLKTQEIVLAMDNLEYVWLENESTLCYIMLSSKNVFQVFCLFFNWIFFPYTEMCEFFVYFGY